MTVTVLIAHARGEETLAAELAAPLEKAGYLVHHAGTVLVGESLVEEAQKLLNAGAPVVLCGTIRAVGTSWARRVVSAARMARQGNRVFVVQMEEEADTESLSLGTAVAPWWLNRAKAEADLVAALQKYFPLDSETAARSLALTAEERYRELAMDTCNLVDLVNLPEGDRHIATRELKLGRLYMALRMRKVRSGRDSVARSLTKLERDRLLRHADGAGTEATDDRFPLGDFLKEGRRLVVLGDPGSGKTTLLRWIATAYLLRLADDPDLGELPDIASLPVEDWLPVLVRCRDLDGRTDGSIDDILQHAWRQQNLSELECASLLTLVRQRLEAGSAMFLLDGLDEVGNPRLRARLCRQLEALAVAFPHAVIITTSRIVGYREMGYRLGRGFQHLTIAELSSHDKDDFAGRWCTATEPADRQQTATAELIADIHSTPRIEALTGNPMLLTTMALVKRKVGTLPRRRADLYWEAVQVLLNWRRDDDLPLDSREALPQLQYVAYAMCDRGVQQLRQDELVDLLEIMRTEYPNVHTARVRGVDDFVRLVEARTGLLTETGEVRHNGRPVPVYEFRHLTLQEYLAGLALVEGHVPDPRPGTLAERIAPLAGRMSADGSALVTESWREPIRLGIASCNNDEVDRAVLAVLNPLPDEGAQALQGRAWLAAACLTDDPNVTDDTAAAIIHAFLTYWRGNKFITLQLSSGRWRRILLESLAAVVDDSWHDYDLPFSVSHRFANNTSDLTAASLRTLAANIGATDDITTLDATLRILDRTGQYIEFGDELLLEDFVHFTEAGTVAALLRGLDRKRPIPLACASCLLWIYDKNRPNRKSPSEHVRGCLLELVSNETTDHAVSSIAVRMLADLDAASEDSVELTVDVVVNLLERLPTDHVGYELDRIAEFAGGAALPVFRGLAASSTDHLRIEVGEILTYLDAEQAWPLVTNLCRDLDPRVRALAFEAVANQLRLSPTRAPEALGLIRVGRDDTDPEVRALCQTLDAALGESNDLRDLVRYITDAEETTRRSMTLAYAKAAIDPITGQLATVDFDRLEPARDPVEPIDDSMVRMAADRLAMDPEEIRRRYEELSDHLGFPLSWRPPDTKSD